MSPRKLTEDDKQNMLELYRNSKATTSTLAQEFGVSSSTVSRFLKNSLSQEEYEDLIQQKRLARTPRGESKVQVKEETKTPVKIIDTTVKESAIEEKAGKKIETTETNTEASPVKKKLSQQIILSDKSNLNKDETKSDETPRPQVLQESVFQESDEDKPEVTEDSITSSPKKVITEKTKKLSEQGSEQVIIKKTEPSKPEKKIILTTSKEEDIEEEDIEDVDVAALSAMLGEEIDDEDDDDTDLDDDMDIDSDDEIDYPHTSSNVNDLEILPLSVASFPRTCYLVVDRSAELIVKPLQEFADLGSIPDEEIQQKTLPVFDNHRIAKRFSHRREKVIKVPDGKMLQKTSQYLYDKGITRLLIRGQIYAIYEE